MKKPVERSKKLLANVLGNFFLEPEISSALNKIKYEDRLIYGEREKMSERDPKSLWDYQPLMQITALKAVGWTFWENQR